MFGFIELAPVCQARTLDWLKVFVDLIAAAAAVSVVKLDVMCQK